jgi:hypothetical protein
MQLARILFVIFFTCSSYAAKSDASLDHDFHFSRLALEWNSKTATWQGILRVFTDDLERGLSAANGNDLTWRLGDRREREGANLAIAEYVMAHWTGIAGPNSQTTLQWNYVGKEIDLDLSYIYIESNAIEAPLPLEITSNGFFELFDDQVNEVTFNLGGESRREWLSQESASVRIESIAP